MGSKAPDPPDYTGAAREQAQASQENVLSQNYANRPSVRTPFGSQSWQTNSVIDPATGQRVTGWTQNVELAPQLQSALDSQMAVQRGRSDLAQGFMQNVESAYQNPFDWQNLPERVLPNAPTQLQGNVADYSQGLQTGVDPMQGLQRGFEPQSLQMSLNTQGLRDIPQYDMEARDQIANQLMERMQPTHERQIAGLQTQLANQGFQVGSEAYNRALGDLMGVQSRERFNALDQAGGEAQRMFNMGLGARQQGFNEAMGAGNFANAAQQQDFSQGMGLANLFNSATGQEFGQNLQAAQFGNQALNQANAMDIARMQAMNQAAGQAFNFGSQFADQMSRQRQQAISEEAMRRSMPLNELNALLTGQQVGMPQMPSFVASGQAQTPDLLGAANMQYQAGLDRTNANNAFMNSLMGTAGQLGSAFMFSDRRLKTDIVKVGDVAPGIGMYEYRWVGTDFRGRGVIAQEVERVRPDLVRRHASGYLQVDYGGL